MSQKYIPILAITFLNASLVFGSPAELFEGFFLDSQEMSGMFNWPFPEGKSMVEFANYDGGLWLYSHHKETTPGYADGGITLFGNPVAVILGTPANYPTGNIDEGVFTIWKSSKWGTSNPANKPIFKVDGLAGNAIFDGADVQINNGNLTISGSSVVTYNNPPLLSEAWNNALIAFGGSVASGENALSNGPASLASGYISQAFGTNASATGNYARYYGVNTVASGYYSSSIGYESTASGPYSYADGYGNVASGLYSYARDMNLSAKSSYENVIGKYNIESDNNTFLWSELDGLFRIGNGNGDIDRSDAVTVLKNGQTTLVNKVWKAAVSIDAGSALNNIENPSASHGRALIVDGHEVMNGKVIISNPQGDISMGIYQ